MKLTCKLAMVSMAVAAIVGAALAAAPAPVLVPLTGSAVGQAGGSAPMVEITKSCPQLRYLGRDAEFAITVTNRGGGTATNVVVTDVLDGGFEFLGADSNGSRQGNRVVWSVGTLSAGQSKTMKVMLRCNTIGTVRNTASVTYCGESMAQCQMDVRGIPGILLECVDDPDPIEVGGELTYTITVTNQGSDTGTNINVVCTVPPEQELVRAAGATAGTASGKTVTFAPLPALAPKARATFLVTVKGTRPADSRFRVSLKSDQMTSPAEETESTHIYE